jgi:hypothetical protein
MTIFVNVKPPDILDLPDAVSFWVVRAMLLLAGTLGGWLAFDTRRSLRIMVEFTAGKSPFRRRWSINPEKIAWIWFYRIDGAVVFVGVIWIFARHYLAR